MHKTTIIGGGPSLKGFDFSLIEGHKIVVNYAYKHVPDYDALVAFDNPEGRGYPIDKLHTIDVWEHPAFKHWPRKGKGIVRDGHVPNHASSMMMAISVAINLGFKDITMIGFDNRLSENGDIHYYKCDRDPNRYLNAFKVFQNMFDRIRLEEGEKITLVESDLRPNNHQLTREIKNISMKEYLSTLKQKGA